jgi:cation-transporting ATPase I
VLEAVPVARDASRRSVACATYGAGAAGVLALAGPRRGATERAGLAVTAASAVSMTSAAWAVHSLGQRPDPVREHTADWHAMAAEEALDRLRSRLGGLTDSEAEHRREGTAEPAGGEDVSGVAKATLEELANPLTPALATGAGLSAALGSVADAGLIGTVMGLNALVGGIQRVGADRAVQRLLDASATRVHVRRGGVEVLLPGADVVVGDVLVLRAGDGVPADCRVVATDGVEVDEATLTGESQLVTKSADPSAAPTVADRRSMLYAGTAVAAGEVTGVVVATGDETEVGRSTRLGVGRRPVSGVEARLRRLTAATVPISLGAGVALLAGGLLHGRPLTRTLSTGVGLAVAAVPEGLPLVATVAQLTAARRLSGRGVLVRHASTIEALGRVDILCADKTGTLTTGRISVHSVSDGTREQPLDRLDDAGRATIAAGLRASPTPTEGKRVPHPTDNAVIKAAQQVEVTATRDAAGWREDTELPFEPSRGYHAVLGRVRGGRRLAVKGAPEVVLPRCTTWRCPEGVVPFGETAQETVHAEIDRLARGGYRVLVVAERAATSRSDLDDDRVSQLELVGLLAMGDPVRPSAAAAVAGLQAAGVSVTMLTGDHPSTAEAIAADLGLLDGRTVMTGPELSALSDDALAERIGSVAVFARVTPEQKVRIVHALQRGGSVVAMTGDGANDAAAIRLADVGLALGKHATNAAKDAADVVVTDNRIETIIDAIVEGRAMWASVRDAVAVLVGGNLGEIALTLGSELLLPGGSPLNARQLLLVNLFTDLVPALALAGRPPVGTNPQRLAKEGPEASLGSALTRDVLVRGGVTAAAGAAGWTTGRLTGVTRRRADTVALVSVIGSQLGQTIAAGWRDPLVVGSTLASGAALGVVVQTPGLSQFFGCRPLGPVGWAIGLGSAVGSAFAAPVVNRVVDVAARQRPAPTV